MSRAALAWVLLLSLWASGPGCAYVRGRVVAEDPKGPVSLTKHVYDEQGRVLTLDKELEKVGSFVTTKTFLAAFYGFAPPYWSWDASEYLNTQLERYGGEAIVELAAEVEDTGAGMTLLAWFSQPNPMIPIWVEVRLSGTVVRRKQAGCPGHLGASRAPPPRTATR